MTGTLTTASRMRSRSRCEDDCPAWWSMTKEGGRSWSSTTCAGQGSAWRSSVQTFLSRRGRPQAPGKNDDGLALCGLASRPRGTVFSRLAPVGVGSAAFPALWSMTPGQRNVVIDNVRWTATPRAHLSTLGGTVSSPGSGRSRPCRFPSVVVDDHGKAECRGQRPRAPESDALGSPLDAGGTVSSRRGPVGAGPAAFPALLSMTTGTRKDVVIDHMRRRARPWARLRRRRHGVFTLLPSAPALPLPSVVVDDHGKA